ncbi:TPA: hypothetical protein NPY75_003185 [Escherichia coli]|nr:hypothetical protein [Escherichia coli]
MIQRYDVDYCTQHACTCEVVKDDEGGYVEYEDYAALEAKYSEAQRELVALRSQVRDASALVKQLHDVVATIGVDEDAPKEEAWNVWFGGLNPVPGEIVEYKLRDGADKVLSRLSDHLHWGHIGALNGSDIAAYRVVKSNDGDAWTAWHGGENPVPGKRVDVKYRDGIVANDVFSDCIGWNRTLLGYGSDIIAYRVVKEG